MTLLAPLIDGVRELHRVGVAHRNVRLGAIGFDRIGTPVLGGFGHAEIVGPLPLEADRSSLTPAEAELVPGFAADIDQVLAIARSVLSATEGADRLQRRVRELSAARGGRLAGDVNLADGDDRNPGEILSVLRDDLFDSADPEPVTLVPDARSSVRSMIIRSSVSDEIARDEEDPAGIPARATVPMWLESLVPAVADLGGPVQRLRSAIASVRRPFWVAAGAAGALLVGGIAVTGLAGGPPATAASTVASSDAPSDPGTSAGPEPERSTAAPTDAASKPESDAIPDPALVGDDPAAAAAALIRARQSCIETRSVLCLDGVDQAGSAAFEADSFTIRQLQDGSTEEPIDLRGAAATVIEHLGGSALIALDLEQVSEEHPAPAVSLLVVRGDGGWRIRDLIVG